MFNVFVWLCPASTAIVSLGLLSNVLVMAVFVDKAFHYMRFSSEIRIHCLYNLLFLVVAPMRLFSVMQDNGRKGAGMLTCIIINWVYQSLDRAMSVNLFLIQLNRFKAVTSMDVSRTKMDALRLPVILNSGALLACTVPASFYTERFQHRDSNLTVAMEDPVCCYQLLLDPYNQYRRTDWMLASVPIMLDGLVVAMLISIGIRIWMKDMGNRRRQRRSALIERLRRETVSESSSIMASQMPRSRSMSDDSNNTDGDVTPVDTVCTSTDGSRVVFAARETKMRDSAMNRIMLGLTLTYLLFEMPQHLPASLAFPGKMTLLTSIFAIQELLRMSKLALELILFRWMSPLFMERSDAFFEIGEEAPFYSDMNLAYKVGLVHKEPQNDDTFQDEGTEQDARKECSGVLLEEFKVEPERLRLKHVQLSHFNRF